MAQSGKIRQLNRTLRTLTATTVHSVQSNFALPMSETDRLLGHHCLSVPNRIRSHRLIDRRPGSLPNLVEACGAKRVIRAT